MKKNNNNKNPGYRQDSLFFCSIVCPISFPEPARSAIRLMESFGHRWSKTRGLWGRDCRVPEAFTRFFLPSEKNVYSRGVYYTTQAHSPVFVLPNLKRVAKPKQKKLPQNCLDKLKLFCEPGGGETPEGPTVLFPDFPIIHKCANEDPWLKRNKIRCHCKMNILEFS